ncbi:zinc finger, CCHC-type containing protein [Tanacetum coccineum]
MAQSIHRMLINGIDTWAPKLPVKRATVDFSSPNIGKEMHVGHLQSTIIGDTLARMLEFSKVEVLQRNHVGDWGTQFGMLLTYLFEQFPNGEVNDQAIGEIEVFYKASKKRFDDDPEFKKSKRRWYRLNVEKVEWIIYLTDVGQKDHFHMFFNAAKRAGWLSNEEGEYPKTSHVGFGLVLGDDGKRFRTRSTEVVMLIDLLDEAKTRCKAALVERGHLAHPYVNTHGGNGKTKLIWMGKVSLLKPGVISLLDEACMFPKSTHEMFAQKMVALFSCSVACFTDHYVHFFAFTAGKITRFKVSRFTIQDYLGNKVLGVSVLSFKGDKVLQEVTTSRFWFKEGYLVVKFDRLEQWFHQRAPSGVLQFEVELQGAQGNRETTIFGLVTMLLQWLKDGAVIMKTGVPGQEGVEGNTAERYRGDNNMAALRVAAVIEEYAHESLTFRDAVAYEVISKWISVMKEDIDTRSNYMRFTCESKVEIWVTKGLLDEAKEIILCMEIFRTQSGNTLRVSRFRFTNGMSVQILLGGHSTLSLEGSLSGNHDKEKKSKGS